MGAYSSYSFGYADWLAAGFPLAMILLVLGWFIGVKVIFPLKPEEKKPQIEGGMERLRSELDAMGKMTVDEYKSIAIFVGVLLMWMTGEWHGIDETTVAFIGAGMDSLGITADTPFIVLYLLFTGLMLLERYIQVRYHHDGHSMDYDIDLGRDSAPLAWL